MGLQQILMMVLGVIIVGVAIVVGLSMFGSNAYKSNSQALVVGLEEFRSGADAYWRLPDAMGGASSDITRVNLASLAGCLGFKDNPQARVGQVTYCIINDVGEYRLHGVLDSTVTILALGKEIRGGKHPFVTYTCDMLNGTVTSEISSAAGFSD